MATGFTYSPYQQSAEVDKKKKYLDSHLESKPEEYRSAYDTQIKDSVEKILSRKDFSYNLNGDALYKQYRDQAMKNGRLAMMDTMGQASAMTGGYGNSYAQTAGQQVYNQSLTDLNNIIPKLYQMALDQYNSQSDQLYKQYSMLADREATDYSRYGDTYGRWFSELGNAQNQYNAERSTDYDRWANNTEMQFNTFKEAQSRAQVQLNWYLEQGMDPPESLKDAAGVDDQYLKDYLASLGQNPGYDEELARKQQLWWEQNVRDKGKDNGNGRKEKDENANRNEYVAAASAALRKGFSEQDVAATISGMTGWSNKFAGDIIDEAKRKGSSGGVR